MSIASSHKNSVALLQPLHLKLVGLVIINQFMAFETCAILKNSVIIANLALYNRFLKVNTIIIQDNLNALAINERYVSHHSPPSKNQFPLAVIFAQAGAHCLSLSRVQLQTYP
jgi:hypothetical protein